MEENKRHNELVAKIIKDAGGMMRYIDFRNEFKAQNDRDMTDAVQAFAQAAESKICWIKLVEDELYIFLDEVHPLPENHSRVYNPKTEGALPTSLQNLEYALFLPEQKPLEQTQYILFGYKRDWSISTPVGEKTELRRNNEGLPFSLHWLVKLGELALMPEACEALGLFCLRERGQGWNFMTNYSTQRRIEFFLVYIAEFVREAEMAGRNTSRLQGIRDNPDFLVSILVHDNALERLLAVMPEILLQEKGWLQKSLASRVWFEHKSHPDFTLSMQGNQWWVIPKNAQRCPQNTKFFDLHRGDKDFSVAFKWLGETLQKVEDYQATVAN